MGMTKRIGREVEPGDAIAFVPGGRPICFHRIDTKQWLHPTLNMTYRLAYELDGTGYALFDDSPLWPAPEEV